MLTGTLIIQSFTTMLEMLMRDLQTHEIYKSNVITTILLFMLRQRCFKVEETLI